MERSPLLWDGCDARRGQDEQQSPTQLCVLHRPRSACVPTGCQHWCPPRNGEHRLKLASRFPSYLSSNCRRDPRAAPRQAFAESPQHFQGRFQPGSWDTQQRFHGKGRGDPSRASRGCTEVVAPVLRADAKIWHLRSQHHQKFLLTSPTQTLVSQGPSGSTCPSSVMGLSPSGNSPREPGYFFFLFCFLFLDEAIRVFPMSW